MRMSFYIALVVTTCLSGTASASEAQEPPHHKLKASADGNLVVGLCDGETSIEVPGVKFGQSLTHEQAQWAADTLMAQWRQKHPDTEWVMAQKESPTAPARGNSESPVVTTKSPNPEAPAAADPGQVQTYGAFTDRDRKIWDASTEALIKEGDRIFHDAKALGGTDAISCDMCHPNAANTHPETYPKFQVQLGRVALLRDMINWCIENPVRGKPFADDDPRMKALEAYILAQRKGIPLDYGKH